MKPPLINTTILKTTKTRLTHCWNPIRPSLIDIQGLLYQILLSISVSIATQGKGTKIYKNENEVAQHCFPVSVSGDNITSNYEKP